MKEIRFKGKDINTSEWVYGNLIWNNGSPYIVGDFVEINEEYCTLEFWNPVEAHTVRESTIFKNEVSQENELCESYRSPKDALIESLCKEITKTHARIVELDGLIKEKDKIINILKKDGLF